MSSLPEVKEQSKQRKPRRFDTRSPQVLTSRIMKADSACELLTLVGQHVTSDIFNDFHISAALTKLARFAKHGKLRKGDINSPVWPRLAARLQTLLKQLAGG